MGIKHVCSKILFYFADKKRNSLWADFESLKNFLIFPTAIERNSSKEKRFVQSRKNKKKHRNTNFKYTKYLKRVNAIIYFRIY